ncbi:M48 family metalloprotease [Trinickia mobilis]|uniref:M48 family metalloprotease n=1 Tax=Trinickia mobilis TaxID=2816356 RepID=UPI001A8FE9F1|nr:M48 family metalloprotease [Trinickia mobilis]
MKLLEGCSALVAALLAISAQAAVSTNVADANFIAEQYCDDTWRAISTVAVAPGDPDIDRAKRIVSQLSDTLGDGDWQVVVFSYPRLGWPVMALMGSRVVVSKEFVDDSNDDELGFVFAHEMGHVILGHLQQRYAALIADAGGRVTRWTQLARYARQEWRLYREEEYQADKFGFALAGKAGFDAKDGAYTALSHLMPDPQHPTPDERLSALGLSAARN